MEKRGDRRAISDLKFEISKGRSAERKTQIPPPTLVGSSSVPMDRVRYRDSVESTGLLKPEMQTAQMTTLKNCCVNVGAEAPTPWGVSQKRWQDALRKLRAGQRDERRAQSATADAPTNARACGELAQATN
jgi:hypothetical protein